MWFGTSKETNGKGIYSCGVVQLQAQKETPSVSFTCVGSANLR